MLQFVRPILPNLQLLVYEHLRRAIHLVFEALLQYW
jgi:hypothetical protein